MKKDWFETWFDSPYYHLLYKSRDESEARAVLHHLMAALQLPQNSRILDLACGKGRYSRYLATLGYRVTGLDISPASIVYARQFEQEGLEFYQHDMRKPFRTNYFDAVLNMFTSFGYFQTDADHLLTLVNAQKNLRPGGVLLLDYFNAEYLRRHLVRKEEKTVDNVQFDLRRNVRGGHVYKNIRFQLAGRLFHFQERVRLFDLADFQQLFEQAGLSLKTTFGGYDLSTFDPVTSKRLILIAQKPG